MRPLLRGVKLTIANWTLLASGNELIVLGKCYVLPLRKGDQSIGRTPQLKRKAREVKLNCGKQGG